MASFYPHGKPEYFSYTEHFMEVGHDYEGAAKANTAYPGLGSESRSITSRALENLQMLINSARAAEVAFINDTGLNLNDPNSAKEVFKIMNTIFNSQDTFNRGLNYMKRLAEVGRVDEKEHTYREVSSYLSTYLRQQITEKISQKGFAKKVLLMSPDQVKNEVNNIIGNALVSAYTKVEDFIGKNGKIRGRFGDSNAGKAAAAEDEQARRAVSDMIEVIKDLQAHGAFRDYGYMFDLDADTLMGRNKKANKGYKLKKKKYDETTVEANYQGNALELITSVVAAKIAEINIQNENLTITGMHTGQKNQMKADSLLFVAEGKINPQDYLDFVDRTGVNKGSVRLQNVDAMAKYLNTLEANLKHVIAISDKNYSIKASFDGVNAQEKMTLQNAGYMLDKFGVPNVVPLIHYLANCGPGMVQGAKADGEIKTALQTYIGYFLFDHLQIDIGGGTAPSGPNVVNLMNVSGMYIPLSVYLEGLYKAIEGSLFNNPSSFVNVSISLGGPTEQSIWTIATWYDFREKHENQSFISYKVLRDISQFITSLI